MFSPEDLQKIVAETLPNDVVPGEKVLVGTVDSNGVRVVAAFKFSDDNLGVGWELQAVAEHQWDGDDRAGGKIILRWT